MLWINTPDTVDGRRCECGRAETHALDAFHPTRGPFASASICGTALLDTRIFIDTIHDTLHKHLSLPLSNPGLRTFIMEGFGEDEIESILYIGREVSGVRSSINNACLSLTRLLDILVYPASVQDSSSESK